MSGWTYLKKLNDYSRLIRLDPLIELSLAACIVHSLIELFFACGKLGNR